MPDAAPVRLEHDWDDLRERIHMGVAALAATRRNAWLEGKPVKDKTYQPDSPDSLDLDALFPIATGVYDPEL